jgi:hypothetical protein
VSRPDLADARREYERSLGCAIAVLVLGLVASFFVSIRLAAVVGAGSLGLLLIALAWKQLARPAAQRWFATGVAAIVAGTWAVAYQPLAGPAASLPAGLLIAGVLGCIGGLALAGRRPSSGQELPSVIGVGLGLAGGYLLVVGLVASDPGGRAALLVGPNLLALGVVVVLVRRRGVRRAAIVTLLLVGVAALGLGGLLGLVTLVQTGYWRVAALAVLGGLVGARTLAATQGRPVVRRGSAVALAVLPVASLAAMSSGPTAVLGVFGLWLSLILIAVVVLWPGRVHAHSGWFRVVAAVLALLAAAAVQTGALALLARGIRSGPGYAQRYGTVARVEIGDSCTQEVSASGADTVTCPVATWSVDGQPVSGELAGTVEELVADGNRASAVHAYVLAKRAYTRGLAKANRFTPLGRAVPLWMLLVLPLGLLAWVPLELRRPRSLRTRQTVPDRAPPVTELPRWSHHTVPLDEVVVDALRLAGRERRDGEPGTTGGFLAALARMDVRTDWQRIWLHTGEPNAIGLAVAPDPPVGGPPVDWQGTPISDRLAQALALLERLCSVYSLAPAGSGATMLALVADRRNGATDALLRHGRLTHAQLLRLVQTELLGLDLPGLSSVVPGATE